jgi:hypothetical protein
LRINVYCFEIQQYQFLKTFNMKNETSITHKLGNNANLLLPAVFSTSVKPKLADKLHHGFQKHSVEIEICFEGNVDLKTKTYSEDWFEMGFYSYEQK